MSKGARSSPPLSTPPHFPSLPPVPEWPSHNGDGEADQSVHTNTRRNSLRRLRSKSLTRFRGSASADSSTKRPPLPTSSSAPSTSAGPRHSESSVPAPVPASLSSVRATPTPPKWPAERHYCACYCEENVYLLAQQLDRSLQDKADVETGWKWSVWVAVITNENKTVRSRGCASAYELQLILYLPFPQVLLWQQRASQSPQSSYPVVWDYHVVVIVCATPIQSVAGDEAVAAGPSRPSTVHGDAPSRGRHDHQQHPQDAIKARKRLSLFSGLKRRPPPGSDGAGNTASTRHHSIDVNGEGQNHQSWHAWVFDIDSVLCHPPDQKTPPRCIPFNLYMDKTFSAQSSPQDYRPMFRVCRADAFLDNFASDRSHMLMDNSDYASPPPIWPVIAGPRAKRKGWTNNLMDKWVQVDSESTPQTTATSTKYQYGRVMDLNTFAAGDWDIPEWRSKRRPTRKTAPVTDDSLDEPPSIPRITSWTLPSTVTLPGTQSTIDVSSINFGIDANSSPPIEPRKGGRVTSPLFPAYMHAVYQHRAARKRDSYLALREATRNQQDQNQGASAHVE